MWRSIGRCAVLAAGVVLAACGGGESVEPPPPGGPGGVDLVLRVPAGRQDGIALVRLDGGQYSQVKSLYGQSRTVGVAGDQLHLMIRGGITGTVKVGRVCVSHVEDTSTWPSGTLVQVAGGQTAAYALRSPGEYVLELDQSTLSKSC